MLTWTCKKCNHNHRIKCDCFTKVQFTCTECNAEFTPFEIYWGYKP